MPTNTTRRTGSNGTRPPGQPDKEQSPLDAALDTLVHAKESLRDAATQLGAAVAHLKQAKRDNRCADREIRTVRSTLKSLRKVRL